jgi:hypothetical protein
MTNIFKMKQIEAALVSEPLFNANYFAECTRIFSEANSALRTKKVWSYAQIMKSMLL